MKKKFICNQCGFIEYPQKKVRGSFWIEIILWLSFIIPGLIYTIWRLTTKQLVCSNCGNATMIPLDSPMGQKLAKDIGTQSIEK